MRPVRVKSTVFVVAAALFFSFLFILSRRPNDEYNFENTSDQKSNGVVKQPFTVRIVKKAIGKAEANENGSTKKPADSQQRAKLAEGEQACRFPQLAIDDPAIKHLFNDYPPLKCAAEKNWIYTADGKFYIDDAVLKKRHNVTCSYTNFWRVSDAQVSRKMEAGFQSGAPLKGDFFTVNCVDSDGAQYKNVHATVVPTQEALKRAKTTRLPADALGLNVYILGFDSVSRMTFMRKMKKTYEYLTKTMNAIVLEGYNIVGDGTPQALIPILTGKTEVELPLTRKRFPNAQYVNVYPFVWNEYKDAGYATLYGEDAAAIGTFTYRLKGFDAQPTDHYMRTFYQVAEGEQKHHKKYCWGSEPHHVVHFRYVEDFWRAYPSPMRKFAFQFHSVLSHDDINAMGVADEDMLRHLQHFKERNYDNDSVIIFMSDHGHRFANLRETQQGKMEERLPFFSFAFPPWFEKKYPEKIKAFRRNAKRLSTPFDIHATLKDILHFDPVSKKGDLKSRELSLFDDIPAERTCSDAAIEPHWCTCLDWTDVPVTDGTVQFIAKALVEAINKETERERKLCSPLRLKSIDKASKYAPATAMLSYKQAKDRDGFVPDLTANATVQMEYYQLDFRTAPGDAHYEASATLDRVKNELIIDLDVVSHVNMFGDSPHCIIDKDYFLIKWCVCYDKISKGFLWWR